MKSLLKFVARTPLILVLLFAIAVFFRFYDLNWGAPYYFHPDERNIASAISQLHFPDQLNPHFFAYGSIPIYFVYTTGILANFLNLSENSDIWTVSFEHAIIIGRFFSALLSALTVILLYKSARIFVTEKLSLLAAFLGTFSVGLIQYAHFGTFETYLTFFSLALFFFVLQYLESGKLKYFILAATMVGILTAIKISSLVLLPLPLLAILSRVKSHSKYSFFKTLPRYFISLTIGTLLVGFITAGIFLLGNPYAILDFDAFYGSMKYESSVATGSLPVFYTGSFIDTTPILFQIMNVFPFLLNPIIWILVIPALTLISITCINKKTEKYRLLLIFFIFLFIPQAILFVKWTRYMVLTLPILYLIIVISLPLLNTELRRFKRLRKFIIPAIASIHIVSSLTWTFALMKTVYFAPDTRIDAANIMQERNDKYAKVLSEVYDLGIIPFDSAFSNISLFNFYELENDPAVRAELPSQLAQSELLILPSQRILKSRMLHPQAFPLGHQIYDSFVSSSTYTKIYQTPCDIWCTILYLGDPIYGVEDTANVFDRPSVMIFKMNNGK